MRQLWVAFILFLGWRVHAAAVSLGPQNFKTLTAKGTWFIEFFSPYCPACQQFAPTWSKLVTEHEDRLKDDIHFGTVDCTAFGDLCREYTEGGVPSVQYFYHGEKVDAFKGAREWDALVAYIAERTKVDEQKERINNVKNPNPSGTSVDLDREKILAIQAGPDRPWFIKYYSPSCMHCQALAPTWEKMAKELQNEVDVGEFDRVSPFSLYASFEGHCADYGISYYPTIKLFANGDVQEYKGDRSLVSLVGFVKQRVGSQVKHVSGTQLAQRVEEDGVALVYLYNKEKDGLPDLLQEVAKEADTGIKFYASNDEVAIRQYRLGPSDLPTALIVKDGRHISYPSREFKNTPEVRDAFIKWIQIEKFPLVSQIGPTNAPEILKGDRLVILAVINHDDTSNTKKFRQLAETWTSNDRKQRNKGDRLLFAELDGIDYADHAKTAYGITKNNIPAILILDPARNQYFVNDQQQKNLSMDQPKILAKMLQDISAGRVAGVSTLPIHEKAGLKLREGMALAQSHWLLSCTTFSVVGVLLYKFMGRRKSRHPILPLKQQQSALEHND
ncbi:hypothetical protein EC973_005311 [Apophysomyces ossiformis]|uniref:Thioredoxin domain-containing protein n=1 Tax=Apophysomyces ossiformis TaxID=679940 RepID=A0A8H7BUH7_9FUNG|nr:hypothetical protein EC973_005311 [Apophysomyces ossiformis]